MQKGRGPGRSAAIPLFTPSGGQHNQTGAGPAFSSASPVRKPYQLRTTPTVSICSERSSMQSGRVIDMTTAPFCWSGIIIGPGMGIVNRGGDTRASSVREKTQGGPKGAALRRRGGASGKPRPVKGSAPELSGADPLIRRLLGFLSHGLCLGDGLLLRLGSGIFVAHEMEGK